MSLDVDWSLLSSILSPERETSFAASFISILNAQLETTTRPSFIGPISVTAFDFGVVGPDIELKDIRDVWRAFDDGDEEGDEALGVSRQGLGAESEDDEYDALSEEKRRQYSVPAYSPLDDEPYDLVQSNEAQSFARKSSSELMDDVSIYSGMGSPRHTSVAGAVGIGLGGLSSPVPFGIGRDYASGILSRSNSFSAMGLGIGMGVGMNGMRTPSLFSQPLHRQPPTRAKMYNPSQNLSRNLSRTSVRPPKYRAHRTRTPLSMESHPPPSPPARPGIPQERPNNPIPSLQLHLSYNHSPNINITLLTSLQINYPSSMFMSLPLKLSITGLTISADMVIAYSGAKHRIHVTIVDDPDRQNAVGETAIPIGQRLLPVLQIESEIGHSDAHVLRNVGKVERFIVDVVRKTLVEEFVFPNFHTIAL